MSPLQDAILQLFTPTGILLIICGTALGIFVGAIPGLTGVMVISLALPLTYGVDPRYAITLLISIYVGAISGAMISSILLRMPGSPASIITTLDGYPLAKKGFPGRALKLGVIASFTGGMISWAFLVVLARPIAILSTHFGPFEYFSLVMMALVMIASIGGASLLRSLFSGVMGILFAMPGIAAATGEPRLTFGMTELNNGFALLPVLIGIFAVNQILQDIVDIDAAPDPIELKDKDSRFTWADFKTHWINLVRSSLIGTWIGILPGIGSNIGSVTAYTVARNSSKHPEKFGTGHEPGIIAAETANNATVGGALIPLVSMGLPGSVVEAVLLGALVIHGLQPGPRLFNDHPDIVYTIMGAMFLANIVMLLIMLRSMRLLSFVCSLPRIYLLPVILVFCVIGSFAISNRLFDVWVMLGFGLLGYLFESVRIPLAPFVIGFILGPIAEQNLSSGLMSTNGDWTPIVTRPISLIFILISLVLLVAPYLLKRKSSAVEETQ